MAGNAASDESPQPTDRPIDDPPSLNFTAEAIREYVERDPDDMNEFEVRMSALSDDQLRDVGWVAVESDVIYLAWQQVVLDAAEGLMARWK